MTTGKCQGDLLWRPTLAYLFSGASTFNMPPVLCNFPCVWLITIPAALPRTW